VGHSRARTIQNDNKCIL